MNNIDYYKKYSLKCESCKDEITFQWMITKNFNYIYCDCRKYMCVYKNYNHKNVEINIMKDHAYLFIYIGNNIQYETYDYSINFKTLSFNELNYDDSDLTTISFEKLFNRLDKLRNIL